MNMPASLPTPDPSSPHTALPLGRGVYTRLPPSRLERLAQRLRWPLTGAAGLASLYLVFLMHAAGQTWLALGALGFFVLVFYIYISQAAFALRYLFPGIAGMLIFIAFPLIYTAQIGFTNYSSAHLLSQERVREYLLDQHEAVAGQTQGFTLHADGPEFRLVLRAEDGSPSWVSPALALKTTRQELSVDMLPAQSAQQPLTAPLQQALPLRELIEHREALMQLKLRLPGAAQELRYLGLREFGAISRHWQAQDDGSLLRLADQTRFSPNLQTGYFESASGEVQQPGFKVVVGWRNYTRMVMDAEFRGPFLAIFSWTVLFLGPDRALRHRHRHAAGRAAELGRPQVPRHLPHPALPALRGAGLHPPSWCSRVCSTRTSARSTPSSMPCSASSRPGLPTRCWPR